MTTRKKSASSATQDAIALATTTTSPESTVPEIGDATHEAEHVSEAAPEASAPAKHTAKKTAAKKAAPAKGTRVAHTESVAKVEEPAQAPTSDHLFFSRDESWLRFNERVLEEAEDASNPLLERVKFLAITASNLDEFVEIRVAGMLQQIEESYGQAQVPDESGLTPDERLALLSERMHTFVEQQYNCWTKALLPNLASANINVLRWSQLDDAAREFASNFYRNEVDPLLTPVTIDPSHPFPRVLNKALCLALLLRHRRKGNTSTVLGVVTIPRSLPRVIALPSNGKKQFIFLHELVESQTEQMFRGYEVLACSAFRVTRNSNLYMQEEESRSVLESVREELHNRRKGDVVRLEIEASAEQEMIDRLQRNFELDDWQVFRTDGPVNLSRLMNLYSCADVPALKYPEFRGRKHELPLNCPDIFAELQSHDILLHHPFDSYQTVEQFVEAAAVDPAVVSMKQTLYRTSANSTIFRALTEAAQEKDVTVVVELMARFDEASNIRWARDLEDAGVGVFHGIYGLKTHAKLALLVRRDPDGVTRRYAHLGTGNYNPVTARFYTDISLLTARPEITKAVQAVFRYLTAGQDGDTSIYHPLLVAPITLASGLLELIAREAEHARAGRPASIVAKMNGLLERKTVEALYEASQAGVEIDLIIRGMCSLRPGVPGLSERIRVRSIVGRFLEHSRIFQFANGGEEEVYCGSADWMARNLHERCEVVFPIQQPELRDRLTKEILGSYLRDDTKARLLQPGGEYIRAPRHGKSFDSQEFLMARSQEPRAVVKPLVPVRPKTDSGDSQ